MFRPSALGQPKNASAYTPPGKETDMQTPLHFILQFDMKSPYNRAYRNAAEALSCSLSAGEAAGKTPCTTIVLCDTDEAIQRHRMAGLPVIAVSHTGNSSEELMGTPWLILSPEALTRDFLYAVITNVPCGFWRRNAVGFGSFPQKTSMLCCFFRKKMRRIRRDAFFLPAATTRKIFL